MSQVIPEGWVNSKLECVVDTIMGGGTPSKAISSYFQGDIPWMSVKDMNKNELVDTVDHISQEAVENSSTNVIPAGTPIVATRMSLGKIVTANFDSAINQDLKALFVNLNIEKSYFVYWYRSIANLIESLGTGTTVKGIRLEVLRGLDFPLPSLAEQKVIADKLDELMAQVENTKARLDAIPVILKSFRQSVLAAAVSGKLTEEWRGVNDSVKSTSISEIEKLWISRYTALGKKFKRPKVTPIQDELTNLPSSWFWTQIGLVCDVYVGATPSRKNEAFWNGTINWVSSSEVAFCRIDETKETITDEGLKGTSTNIHPKGTVMLAMIGQGKTRGQPAILDIEACHNQNTAAIRVLDSHCSSEYLYYFLFECYEETRRVGSGNNQQAMNKTVVQSLAFPLPPIEEQTEIVRRVEELFAFADKVEAQVNAAQERVNNLPQSILAKAFKGELTAEWRAANPELITGDNSAESLLERIKAEREALALAAKAAKKKPVNKARAKKAVTNESHIPSINRNLSPVESVIADGVAHKPQEIFDKLTPDLSMTEVFNEISKLLSDNKIEEKTVDGITGFFIK